MGGLCKRGRRWVAPSIFWRLIEPGAGG